MTTPEKALEELIAAREKGTKGKWVAFLTDGILECGKDFCAEFNEGYDALFCQVAANFAAHDAPKLLARYRKMEEALRYYSNEQNYEDEYLISYNKVWEDKGEIARQALQDDERNEDE